jgi:hypothetical protein
MIYDSIMPVDAEWGRIRLDAHSYRSVSDSVNEAIAERLASCSARPDNPTNYFPKKSESGVRKNLKLIMGALVYISKSGEAPSLLPPTPSTTSRAAQRCGKKKRAKLARKHANGTKLSRTVYGQKIVVRNRPHQDPGSPNTGDSGRKLDKRFQVRRHFRWQAHGPDRSLRKKIIIAPFWKGPKDGREWLNNYLVMTPSTAGSGAASGS